LRAIGETNRPFYFGVGAVLPDSILRFGD